MTAALAVACAALAGCRESAWEFGLRGFDSDSRDPLMSSACAIECAEPTPTTLAVEGFAAPKAAPEGADMAIAAHVEPGPPTPVAYRVSRRSTPVYAEARRRWRTRRGEIAAGKTFAIHAHAPGSECAGEGWVEVEAGGFVCLEDAQASDGPVHPQPELQPDRRTPFIYAKPRVVDRARKTIAAVPRYRDRLAFARGDDPIDHLEADRFYAFVAAKKRGSRVYLVDADDRVVPAKDLKIARESAFAGRDLATSPIPEGLEAGWSVSRPAPLRAAPRRFAKKIGEVAYHALVDVRPEAISGRDDLWYVVPGAAPNGGDAYIAARDLNRWIPGPALAEVDDDALWIDVELGQQTLALMRGSSPIWITLMSSGANGADTPTGIFRITEKHAVAAMRSAPGASQPYHVEGVPWVQYFHGRVAIHAAFWHDDFGKRRSHGCVNLSPSDAAFVFERTTPSLPPGWTTVRDPDATSGTLVRIRRGVEPVSDRRSSAGTLALEGEDARPRTMNNESREESSVSSSTQGAP